MSLADLRGVYSIWLRDVTRYRRDKARIISSVAQPALFLFIFGTGLSRGLALSGRNSLVPGGGDYLSFIYPGILGMSLLFTATFSAVSIIWDREFGFLKEVMVAPISRSAVAVGKALGGSTVSVIQGAIILLFAPLIGVPLDPLQVLVLLPVMFLIAFAITSMGIVIAARMETMEGFQMIMNFLIMPLFLLSGAMFPLSRLPNWLQALTRVDPLTYGVDALRGIVIGPSLAQFSLAFDLGIIIVFGSAMITLAVWFFNRPM